MVKIQVGLKSCSFHRRIQWWNSFCPTRLLLARKAKNVSKISAQLWSPRGKLGLSSPRAHRKTSSLVTSRRARGDEVRPPKPSWAKWVSPLNSSMKTTNFKPNLYFYHRIPLRKSIAEDIVFESPNKGPRLYKVPVFFIGQGQEVNPPVRTIQYTIYSSPHWLLTDRDTFSSQQDCRPGNICSST